MSIRFDVALSFAGDTKKDKIRIVAEILRQRLGDGKVFFDEWFEHELAGADAQIYLQTVYGQKSQLVVACVCNRYGQKPWTQDEWRAILAFERGLRDASRENRKRLRFLPIRFDDGSVDGLFSTAIVPDVRDRSAEDIAELIIKRLDQSRGPDRLGRLVNQGTQSATAARKGHTGLRAAGPHPSLLASSSAIWSLNKLQRTEYRLEGRSAEMSLLTTAWREPKGRIVAIEGPGGAGKTAIVRAFLDRLRFPGVMPQPDRVYGWTFHNQGQEDFESTAIGFVRDALKCLGRPPDGPRPFSDLIDFLREHRCVLVLDGIETQPRDENGDLTQYNNQEGLRSFLRELCENDLPKGGLIVITSKERINEIKPQAWNTEVIALAGLRDNDGAALLRDLGVSGQPEELQQASRELKGNALALVILGSFLRVHGLRINQRDRIQLPTAGDAQRVIEFYAGELEEDERKFLRLLGLFGRPMNSEDLDGLRRGRPCSAVEFLNTYSPQLWDHLIKKLRDLHLLNAPERQGLLEEWDTHPLVRQHFAEELRDSYEEQWREAHGKLFDLYSACDPSDPFDSDELLALFGAVRHGCLAGRYSDAYNLYRSRIAGEFKGYDTENSALAPEALLALSAFFNDRNYTDPVAVLDQYEMAWLLARVSYCLHSLGDLAGAVGPRIVSNRIYEELRASTFAKVRYEASRDAAYGAEMLSQIYKRLGELRKATEAARKAVTLADASEKDEPEARADVRWKEDYREEPVPGWLRYCSTRAALGTALHKQGKFKEADQVFGQAAQRHDLECPRDRTFSHCPDSIEPVFHSEPGVWWALLRLDMAKDIFELHELEKISERMKQWSEQANSKSSAPINGLHRMLHGMVKTELADLRRERKLEQRQLLLEASQELTQAVSMLRESQKYHFLCDVLVTRARTSRLLLNAAQARRDLNETWEISERCGMRLTQVDSLILQGHLHLDERQPYAEEAANEVANKAGELIAGIHYVTAEPALRLLEWRLKQFRRRGIDLNARVEAQRAIERVPIPRFIKELHRYERGDWKP